MTAYFKGNVKRMYLTEDANIITGYPNKIVKEDIYIYLNAFGKFIDSSTENVLVSKEEAEDEVIDFKYIDFYDDLRQVPSFEAKPVIKKLKKELKQQKKNSK